MSDYRVALFLAGGSALGTYEARAMDVSRLSVRSRWDAGHRDGRAFMAALRDGTLPVGGAGLHILASAAAS